MRQQSTESTGLMLEIAKGWYSLGWYEGNVWKEAVCFLVFSYECCIITKWIACIVFLKGNVAGTLSWFDWKKGSPHFQRNILIFPVGILMGIPYLQTIPVARSYHGKNIEFPANAPSSTYCWGFLHGILCVHFFMINLKTFSILSTMINIGIVFADYVVIFVNTLLAIRSVNILKPPRSCVLANWSANSTSCMKTGLKKVTKCKRW